MRLFPLGDDEMFRTIVQMFDERVKENPLYTAQLVKDAKGVYYPVTYIQLQEKVRNLALALRRHGVRRNDIVGIMSDNRAEWLEADLAILSLGAADAPRGRDAMDYEIEYILSETEAKVCFAENLDMADRILSLKKNLEALKVVVVMDGEKPACTSEALEERKRSFGVELLVQSELEKEGAELMLDFHMKEEIEHEIMLGSEEDVCTIIFTSGTTGNPKGVMLTHRNMLYQLEHIPEVKHLEPQMRWLAVLPVWHSFERIVQYIILDARNVICYSKPIGKIMLVDMIKAKPHFICSVPRIWETVKAGVNQSLKNKSERERKLFAFFLDSAKRQYRAKERMEGRIPDFKKRSRILDYITGVFPYLVFSPVAALGRKLVFKQITSKFGPCFIGGISGGGTMSKDVQEFFTAMGLVIVDGYGLTETAPVIGVQNFDRPMRGCMTPFKGTELKVLDEDGKVLPPGRKGVLHVRGPQVMKGYYKREDLTRKVLDKDGWLDTGDLAIISRSGDFSIVGRAKDTIVLAGGENIEPVPIENKLKESEYIDTAVVLGQDRKFLGALVVINEKNCERYLKENHIPYVNRENLAETEEIKALINREIQEKVSSKTGFKSFEQINRFALLDKPFEVGKELSAKQEFRRHKINEIYQQEIAGIFA